MNLYDATVPQLSKMIHNLDLWLDAGAAFAEKKKFEPDRLLTFRLAPDMYALVQQVQSVADNAKFICAHLTGKQAPAHPDTETTIAQCKARLHTVQAYLETYKREDFEGAGERKIAPKWAGGKSCTGLEYLTQIGLPNFYFHVTVAYAILRQAGVELGKQDFMGAMPLRD